MQGIVYRKFIYVLLLSLPHNSSSFFELNWKGIKMTESLGGLGEASGLEVQSLLPSDRSRFGGGHEYRWRGDEDADRYRFCG